jgi:hypothetical protein
VQNEILKGILEENKQEDDIPKPKHVCNYIKYEWIKHLNQKSEFVMLDQNLGLSHQLPVRDILNGMTRIR